MSYHFGQLSVPLTATFNIPSTASGNYIYTFNTNDPLYPYVGQKPPPPLFKQLWEKLF